MVDVVYFLNSEGGLEFGCQKNKKEYLDMSAMENIVKTICFECHSRCGVLLHVKDGRIESIEGDKSHPISEGFMCPKGRAVKEIVYHPDRLLYPQKRIGSKGEKKWERITWDEALDTIAAKLTQIKENYGAEAIVTGHGTSRGLSPYLSYFQRCLGSPNKMLPLHLSGAPVAIGNYVYMWISTDWGRRL